MEFCVLSIMFFVAFSTLLTSILAIMIQMYFEETANSYGASINAYWILLLYVICGTFKSRKICLNGLKWQKLSLAIVFMISHRELKKFR